MAWSWAPTVSGGAGAALGMGAVAGASTGPVGAAATGAGAGAGGAVGRLAAGTPACAAGDLDVLAGWLVASTARAVPGGVAVCSSTAVVEVVEKFVPVGALDPIYYDSSYYLAPDGEAGEDVFAVLRDAIAPMGRGLVAHTLREQRDLNDAGEIFRTIPDAKPDPEMIKLARQLIDRQTGSYDPADVQDRYEARLRDLIEAKLKGEGLAPENVAAAGTSNVVDLMAALRRSVEQSKSVRGASESFQAATAAVEQETGTPRRQKAASATTPTSSKKSARR